jgi:hypothetical protein
MQNADGRDVYEAEEIPGGNVVASCKAPGIFLLKHVA